MTFQGFDFCIGKSAFLVGPTRNATGRAFYLGPLGLFWFETARPLAWRRRWFNVTLSRR